MRPGHAKGWGLPAVREVESPVIVLKVSQHPLYPGNWLEAPTTALLCLANILSDHS